jgi:hypothetical protein
MELNREFSEEIQMGNKHMKIHTLSILSHKRKCKIKLH